MPYEDHAHTRIIALAALMQTSKLVDDIARKGSCDTEDFNALIHSLFTDSNTRPEALFGGNNHLKSGLLLSKHMLSGESVDQAKAVMAYTASLIAVEKKLHKHDDILQQIADGMQRVQKQANYFDSMVHESVIGGIADLYGNTISTLTPRIIIHGKPEILRQHSNTNKVRALLLSGIRAAHLWRQHKGGHFRLLFGRKKLLRDIDSILKTL
ncbi:MAG: high frequency lysogenization protein HflD [Mariprofundaceae bacterium]|nr:high frequency lysogenization protein HflD [Mariprofundaceae bacterium]